MTSVLVAQQTFTQPGGAIRVGLTLIDELLRSNCKVSVALLHKVDLQQLSRVYFNRELPKSIAVYWLFPGLISEYQRLFLCLPILRAIKKENPDVVFIDHDSYKLLRRYLRDRKVIHYVHFPSHSRRLFECFPNIVEECRNQRYSRFPFSLYTFAYGLLQQFVLVDNDFADIICANSSFTAEIVKKIWNRDAIVLFPPVSVNDFVPLRKKNTVVSVGRIEPGKHFEDLIKAIGMCETEPRLQIIGGLTSTNIPYLNELQQLVAKSKLGYRVRIEINAPYEVVRRVLGSARIYVHPKHWEHFGISIVEAMASGCVPIVHRSGGPYYDIIDGDRYGFSFNTIEELAENIDVLMTSDISSIAKLCIQRSRCFSEEKFRTKAIEMIGI